LTIKVAMAVAVAREAALELIPGRCYPPLRKWARDKSGLRA
jgi:hypothetical protein